eukprot:976469_1
MGFEDSDNDVIRFKDFENIDVSVPASSVTLMGLATKEHKSHPLYQPNQGVQLLGTILHYDPLTQAYSVQLRPNTSNETSQLHTYTIQIPSEYIHILESDHDLSCVKHTANQNEITLNKESSHNIRNGLKCILSLYASDAIHLEYGEMETSKPTGDICDGMFRRSPFENLKVLSNIVDDDVISVKQLVQHDEVNDIYFYHLGCKETKPDNQVFLTPKLKWPNSKYSFALWVYWGNDYALLTCSPHLIKQLTTFDSSHYAPIYVDDRGHLGCHSGGQGDTVTTYTVENGWNFVHVIALGSTNKTTFYVGNLTNPPQMIGSVRYSVCGQETERIGEQDQGPGKLAFVTLLDGHLDDDEMTQ